MIYTVVGHFSITPFEPKVGTCDQHNQQCHQYNKNTIETVIS